MVLSKVLSAEAPILVISVCTELFNVSTEARKLLISLVSAAISLLGTPLLWIALLCVPLLEAVLE